MLVKFLRTLFLLGLVSSLLVSCGDDEVYVHGEDLQKNTLVQETNSLRNSIAEGNLFNASTVRDRQLLQSIIIDIRAAAIALQENPRHENALLLMVNSLRALTSRTYLQEDQYEMNQFVKNLSSEVQKYASIQGKNITDLAQTLYTYRFSSGLSPFGSFGWDEDNSSASDSLKWSTREALDRWFTSVNVYTPSNFTPDNFQTWLLTPTFDLTDVKNPKFRIRNGYNLDGKDPNIPIDASRIINESYMAMVSTDYIDGDPNEATWKRVPLYTRLEGRNFDSATSNVVDLSEFEGKKVVIAFVIAYEGDIHGQHAIGWTIEQFDLLGLGTLGEIEGRTGKLYENRFTRTDYSPFQVKSFVAGKFAVWRPDGFPPKDRPDGTPGRKRISWMIINPRKKADFINTYLFSPHIDMADTRGAVLTVYGTVRNPIWDNMKVLISDSYAGTDPRTFSAWEQLEITPEMRSGLEKPASWNKFTFNFTLPEKFRGKKVTLAFHYENDGTKGEDIWNFIEKGKLQDDGTYDGRNDRNGTVWQIEGLRIEGRGDILDFQKVDLNFDSAD